MHKVACGTFDSDKVNYELAIFKCTMMSLRAREDNEKTAWQYACESSCATLAEFMSLNRDSESSENILVRMYLHKCKLLSPRGGITLRDP